MMNDLSQSGVIHFPLNGDALLISKEHDIEIPIDIPGSVFDALLEAKKIEDPFYGINEHKLSWVYNSSWTIIKEFELPKEIKERQQILLKFYGIDTFAEIFLNEEKIGSTENMHQEYEFDIKKYLVNGTNLLKIIFDSAPKIAVERSNADQNRVDSLNFSMPGRSYTLKAQYSYGWDWGPKLPDIGIWRDAEIIGIDTARILNVQVLPEFEQGFERMHLKIKIESQLLNLEKRASNQPSIEYQAKLSYLSPQELSFTMMQSSKDPLVEFDFKPELWWTAEQGLPNLYELTVGIVKDGLVIDEITQRIGFRNIALIRREDEWGESFFFELNGVPIFAKGADWIPHHSFIPKGRRLGLYQSTILDALEANMNMLRVWGGGVMEDDEFYEICDEVGMLIWQDFPFACGRMPSIWNPDGNFNSFYHGVETLAIQNIKRLRNHPSLALWCGNNEMEEAHEHVKADDPIKGICRNAYIQICEKLLPALCKDLDPTRSYWPASPSSGGLLMPGDYIKSQSELRGDAHFWTVWHGGAEFMAYRSNFCRFMSEFGFESFPDLKTCFEFCPPEQFEFESPIMKNHQKNPAGNGKIMNYMQRRFKIPPLFEDQVTLSQLTQAEAIEYGVEHWRRQRGCIGKERCMGALYWQLNDCWPVASWSSIDYSKKLAEEYGRPGRWKALHYYAKRFYKPIIASIAENRDWCEIFGINDLNRVANTQLEWSIIDLKGNNIKNGIKEKVLAPCSSQLIEKIYVGEYFGHKHLIIEGTFFTDDDGNLRYLEKERPNDKINPNNLPLVKDVCSDILNTNISIKYYSKVSMEKSEKSESIENINLNFEGYCELDDDGVFCLKKQLTAENPELYDVPISELLEGALEKDQMIFEINAYTLDPSIMIVAKLYEGKELISESYRLFKAPGDLPLEDPKLEWRISEGSGTEWMIEINTSAPALMVYLWSYDLDFWGDDNYFFISNGKKNIKIILLEPVTEKELKEKLIINSLYGILTQDV